MFIHDNRLYLDNSFYTASVALPQNSYFRNNQNIQETAIIATSRDNLDSCFRGWYLLLDIPFNNPLVTADSLSDHICELSNDKVRKDQLNHCSFAGLTGVWYESQCKKRYYNKYERRFYFVFSNGGTVEIILVTKGDEPCDILKYQALGLLESDFVKSILNSIRLEE